MEGCIGKNIRVKFAVYQAATEPLLSIKSTVYLKTYSVNATILLQMKAWPVNNEILKRRWTRMWPTMRDLPGNCMEVRRELQRSSERIGTTQAKIPTWHLPAVLPLQPAYPVPRFWMQGAIPLPPGKEARGVWEHGAEENIWTLEGRGNGGMEEIA